MSRSCLCFTPGPTRGEVLVPLVGLRGFPTEVPRLHSLRSGWIANAGRGVLFA